jgi:hypothetical protein
LLFAAQQPWAEIASEADFALGAASLMLVECIETSEDFLEVLVVLPKSVLSNEELQLASEKADRLQAEMISKKTFAEWAVYSEFTAKYWRELVRELAATGGSSLSFRFPSRVRISSHNIPTAGDRTATLFRFPKQTKLQDIKHSPIPRIEVALFKVLAQKGEFDSLEVSSISALMRRSASNLTYSMGMSISHVLAQRAEYLLAEEAFSISQKLPSKNTWSDLHAYFEACQALGKKGEVARLQPFIELEASSPNSIDVLLRCLTSDSRTKLLPIGAYRLVADSENYIVVISDVTVLHENTPNPEWLSDAVQDRYYDLVNREQDAVDFSAALNGVAASAGKVLLGDPHGWLFLERMTTVEEGYERYWLMHAAKVGADVPSKRGMTTVDNGYTFTINENEVSSFREAKKILRTKAVVEHSDSKLPGWSSEIDFGLLDLESLIPEVWLSLGAGPQWHVGVDSEALTLGLLSATSPVFLSLEVIIDNSVLSKKDTIDLFGEWWGLQNSAFHLIHDASSEGLSVEVCVNKLPDIVGSTPSDFAGRPDKAWAMTQLEMVVSLPDGLEVIVPLVSGKKYYGRPPKPLITKEDMYKSINKNLYSDSSSLNLRLVNSM